MCFTLMQHIPLLSFFLIYDNDDAPTKYLHFKIGTIQPYFRFLNEILVGNLEMLTDMRCYSNVSYILRFFLIKNVFKSILIDSFQILN